jgi:hypothetical protein
MQNMLERRMQRKTKKSFLKVHLKQGGKRPTLIGRMGNERKW